jgi:DNA-binding GntR family transcriptional regulator
MSAELADAETAKHLGLRRGAPILTVVRENYTEQGVLVQLAKSYYRTDRYRFVINLSQRDGFHKDRSFT